MQIVGIVPARYESSRYPGKPLADIFGKPMIQHVYERARRTPLLDRVLVATEDQRIMNAVKAFGGEAVLTRSDHPSGTDRLAEACRILGLAAEDIVVNIQGDEPLVEPAMIQRLVQALKDFPDCPVATLAFPTEDEKEYLNPNVVKVVVGETGKALYFSRAPIPCHRDAGSTPVSFLKHLGFYAYRHAFLQTFTTLPPGKLEQMEKLEQLRVIEQGYAIQVALSPKDTVGVDTPEDLQQLLTLHKGELFNIL